MSIVNRLEFVIAYKVDSLAYLLCKILSAFAALYLYGYFFAFKLFSERYRLGIYLLLSLFFLCLSPSFFVNLFPSDWASLVAQLVKNLPAMWETWV